jgi:hypothetical protein
LIDQRRPISRRSRLARHEQINDDRDWVSLVDLHNTPGLERAHSVRSALVVGGFKRLNQSGVLALGQCVGIKIQIDIQGSDVCRLGLIQ